MSNTTPLARYAFLPWLRRGIANQMNGHHSEGRAEVDVQVVVNQNLTVSKTILLIGPDQIIGIDSRAIIKTEPRAWATNFEPNLLAHIEFYDQDFPWRYTPTPPDTNLHRLPPWIFLLVLKESEFTVSTVPGKPLPILKLKAHFSDVLPKAAETWAWATVHLNEELSGSNTPDLNELNNILDSQPDLAISRLISPRRLKPLTNYHAFLIPAFEGGRQSGLGNDVTISNPTASSWGSHNTDKEFPVYYTWYFKTCDKGDFEYLVTLLQPRPVPIKVGIRDMDIQRPGFGIDSISHPTYVGLEGALLPPNPHHKDLNGNLEFPKKLQPIVNLSVELQSQGSPDPVVTPPLYGCWPARVNKMDYTLDNWIQTLNKDPRWRTAAGMGVQVVQKNENNYLADCWQQVGSVLAANQKIKRLQWSMNASLAIFSKYLNNITAERLLQLTAPVHPKVLAAAGSGTIRYQVNNSTLPQAALNGAFRKLIRPRGILMKRFFGDAVATPGTGNSPGNTVGQIISQLNNGTITAAPPKQPPANLPTVNQVSTETESSIPAWQLWLSKHKTLLLILLLIVVVIGIVLLILGKYSAGISLIVAAVGAYFYLRNLQSQETIESTFTTTGLTPQAVQTIPQRSDFTILTAGTLPAHTFASGGTDDIIAANFRSSLEGFATLLQQTPAVPAKTGALDISAIQTKLTSTLHPYASFTKRFTSLIHIGNTSLTAITPVMAYPDIKDAMYKPLTDISKEYFVPNLHLIAPNTITLMINNQSFIESYMVGLNYQMAKALLWNEYPTDQMGTYFRQFWDTSKYVDPDNLPPDQLAEKLRDIKPIHTWPANSQLGDHNNRQPQGNNPQLVLVIRGELLKRYPNAVIYAQKAIWGTDNFGQVVLKIDESLILDTSSPSLEFPLYNAQVDPDINFIGFELTVDEAKGKVTEESAAEEARLGNNDLGWFFIIKEMPGEPKFGLDETIDSETATPPLSWQNFPASTKVLDVNVAQDSITHPLKWDSGTNSADVSDITYRQPVLCAVHARQMLQNLNTN